MLTGGSIAILVCNHVISVPVRTHCLCRQLNYSIRVNPRNDVLTDKFHYVACWQVANRNLDSGCIFILNEDIHVPLII